MLSTRSSRLAGTLALAVLAATASPAARSAEAQSCPWSPDLTPATPPPTALWGEVQPAYTTLPSGTTGSFPSRDTTWYEGNGNYGLGNPYWETIDIEGNYLFAATNVSVQVWNIGSNPTEPTRLANTSIASLAPVLQTNPHDYFITHDIDAAPGDPTLLGVTGEASMGMLVVNATAPSSLRAYYQDHGQGAPPKDGWDVYVTEINGNVYGFTGTVGGTNGIWAYDMTKAKQLGATTPCVEETPNDINCPGVFLGRMSTGRTQYLGGTSASGKHFLVAAGGDFSNKGFKIWDIGNPSNPVLKLTGLTNDTVNGVAMWSQGGKVFLALANRKTGVGTGRGQFYDVTCVLTSCGSLGNPIYDFPLDGHTSAGVFSMVTFSRTNGSTGTPYVHFGRRNNGNINVLQSEWLFDVTGLSATNPPHEMTGGDPLNGNAGQPTIVLDGKTIGYWGWYSMCNPSGSNYFRPNMSIARGNYLYRAGNSILDIHELDGTPPTPTITVSGPTTGYTGQTLSYTASASGCSPTAGQWQWFLIGTGGQIVGGSTGPSVNVQWSLAGAKSIRAENLACAGADSVAQQVQITNAAPSIGSVTANPTSAPVCTQISFGANATGQPPLTYNWTIEQSGDPVPGEGGSGNPFVWDTEGISPGTYQGRVTVSGPGGSDEDVSPQVTLTALPALPNAGFPISNDPPDLGEVQFHSNVAGATEWRWTFGDGTILETQDPAQGEDPVHVYAETGTYTVTLEVRNCVETTYRRSAELQVTIDEVAVLDIVDFRALCTIAPCIFSTGSPVTFVQTVEGEPTLYQYDWQGEGTFEQSSPTPVTSHTYPTAGTYTPRLKVTQGTQTDTFTAVPVVVVSGSPNPTPNPSIIVAGPTSRLVGQTGTYTATASNCVPSANGWNWNTAGGTGSSTTSSITLSWTTSGNKVISASNSACGGASDTHVINVTTPGGGNPGDLSANFTFSPASPSVGQSVSFDASSSTGEIIDWSWSFGDGALGSGETVSHVFDRAGTFSVALSVAELGANCPQGVCFESITKTVTVGGGGNGGGGNGECVQDDETLCLMNGRFAVRSSFLHPQNGIQRAKVYDSFSADRTGMFWFFRPDNVELITKSLDGTNPDIFPNPAYWFFYGGLSSVEYWIEVTDTAVDPPKTVEYHNDPGVICGRADTGAFPTEDVPNPVQGAASAPRGTNSAIFPTSGPGVIAAGGSSGTCVPSAQRLCLLDGRYAVEVDWHDQGSGDTGVGQAIPGTSRTGYFWFFRDDNIELVTKMLDPGPPFEHVWVFWGALSNVEYTIKVTDTVTQQQKQYHNPAGSFCGGADTTAFDAD